jgi:anti-sigma regulatory factor (Ser/Thr protein kinase)
VRIHGRLVKKWPVIESLQREYTAATTVPAAARRAAFELLPPETTDERTSVAMLLVTELVSNAVVHVGCAIQLRLTLTGDRLRIEVFDTSLALPRARDPGAGGRGLRIVEELSDSWGVVREDGPGKTTWCEMSTA